LYVFESGGFHFGGGPLDRSFERSGTADAIPDAVAEVLETAKPVVIGECSGD
jgi:hypothetical protein